MKQTNKQTNPISVHNKLVWGDGVAQWVERRTRVPRSRVRIPSGAQDKFVRVCPSQKCLADSLSVCPNPRVYTCIYIYARIRTYARERPCSPCNVGVRWSLETRRDPACTKKCWLWPLYGRRRRRRRRRSHCLVLQRSLPLANGLRTRCIKSDYFILSTPLNCS